MFAALLAVVKLFFFSFFFKFGSPYLGKATAAAPIPTSVCSIFVYPKNGMTANV